jgi:hypothetical protein
LEIGANSQKRGWHNPEKERLVAAEATAEAKSAKTLLIWQKTLWKGIGWGRGTGFRVCSISCLVADE